MQEGLTASVFGVTKNPELTADDLLNSPQTHTHTAAYGHVTSNQELMGAREHDISVSPDLSNQRARRSDGTGGRSNLRSVRQEVSAELRLPAEVSVYMPAASPVQCVLLRFQDSTNSSVAEHQPVVQLRHAT